MYTIQVDKECGCFKRSVYENNTTFESKDEALIKATLMRDDMNEKFCGKHNFELRESGDNFLIGVSMDKQTKSGCCGGGHCS